MKKITNCDMCGSEIQDGKCSCGTWEDDTTKHPMRLGIEAFHEMKQFTFTGDAPHLGCAVVYFRRGLQRHEESRKIHTPDEKQTVLRICNIIKVIGSYENIYMHVVPN